MIDVVKEVGMFKPIDLTHIPEIYKPATEQMRTSFILYNKALHEVQSGHEDIAKNYLRKAVTIRIFMMLLWFWAYLCLPMETELVL